MLKNRLLKSIENKIQNIDDVVLRSLTEDDIIEQFRDIDTEIYEIIEKKIH